MVFKRMIAQLERTSKHRWLRLAITVLLDPAKRWTILAGFCSAIGISPANNVGFRGIIFG